MMVVIQRSASTIRPADWNVRMDHDLDGIAKSILVNGFRDPIEVWASQNGVRLREPHEIVVGEGRYRAATERLAMTEVPVIEHEFSDAAAAQRYSIANNRLTDKSAFDQAALLGQLEELDSLDGTGFSASELEELVQEVGEPTMLVEADEVPSLDSSCAFTEPGDVWQLGVHRVLCADAADSVARQVLLHDLIPRIWFLDPPWESDIDEILDSLMALVHEEATLFLMHADAQIAKACARHIDLFRRFFVYKRSSLDPRHTHAPLHNVSLLAEFARTSQFICLWDGFRTFYDSGTGYVPDKGAEYFVYGKDVAFIEGLLTHYSKPSQLVYDPFLGSGTTLIAAHRTWRACYGSDVDPHWVDVIVRRWMRATGMPAIRERDGATLPMASCPGVLPVILQTPRGPRRQKAR